ncbi:glycerol kinase [Sesbania bispinosa]|nr:glycerol kinase [Sesbania bispinosa]
MQLRSVERSVQIYAAAERCPIGELRSAEKGRWRGLRSVERCIQISLHALNRDGGEARRNERRPIGGKVQRTPICRERSVERTMIGGKVRPL